MKKRLSLKMLLILFVVLVVTLIFSACNETSPEIRFMDGDKIHATVQSWGNELVDMPTNPTSDEHYFRGWFYDKEYTQPFTEYSLLNTPLKKTLFVYAKWQPIPALKNVDRVKTDNGLVLELSKDSTYYSVILCNDEFSKIVVDSHIDNIPVTTISDDAFSSCVQIVSITLPSTITSIGKNAFEYCHNLQNINIPNGVTEIQDSSFRYTGIASILLPDSITQIGNDAFSGCNSLESITIPNGVTVLGKNVFSSCNSLESITIPNGVTVLGENVFYGCESLVFISIPDSVETIGQNAFDSTAWFDNQPDGFVYAGKFLYQYKGTMPENTTVDVKAGTKFIVDRVFAYNQNIVGITIPASVQKIGAYAMYGCINLDYVDIENGSKLTTIEHDAFSNTKISSITLPNGLESIGDRAFYYTSLVSITIPASVTNIGEHAFSLCPLDSIAVDEDSTSFRLVDGALFNFSLTELLFYPNRSLATTFSIPQSVTYIHPAVFQFNAHLTSILFSDGITKIGSNAFSFCSQLTSIYIPDSVVEIEFNAFVNCKKLESITLPATVVLGYDAFAYSPLLSKVYYFGANQTEWDALTNGISTFDSSTVYYYSETKITDGIHWHMVDGVPTIWS